MDIDDILAAVDPGPAVPAETVDLQALTRAWVNEKNAPELLPWPEALMDRVTERIRAQVGRCRLSPARRARATLTVGRPATRSRWWRSRRATWTRRSTSA